MKTALILLAAAALGTAIALVICRIRERRQLNRLRAMLDDAASGHFDESAFDESLLSAVESQLVHFLSASAMSARNVAAERDKIKTLIADISHQTKTPIANLLLYAQLLAEQDLPDACRPAVAALGSQSEKLRFLIESLVKLSRLETGIIAVSPVMGPVAGLLDEVEVQFQGKAAEKGLTLSVLPTQETAVYDPKWTLEALGNLLENAVKYTPPGGSVTVSATAYELFLRVDVKDTGIGVSEDDQPRIFARFYRAKAVREQEGVGIGLFLAREIVTAQGGYLKVQSRPGEGSVFSLFLPRT